MQSIIQTDKPYLFRLSSGLLRASSTGMFTCEFPRSLVGAGPAAPRAESSQSIPSRNAPDVAFTIPNKRRNRYESISNQNH
ncbi:hypothetical protein MTP99_006108 [Tenebrio molitor]|nr:hypothetical protein MTP99_006108 [Tenebrio molitor]